MATAKEMATMKSNMKSFVKVIEEKEKKEHHPPVNTIIYRIWV